MVRSALVLLAVLVVGAPAVFATKTAAQGSKRKRSSKRAQPIHPGKHAGRKSNGAGRTRRRPAKANTRADQPYRAAYGSRKLERLEFRLWQRRHKEFLSNHQGRDRGEIELRVSSSRLMLTDGRTGDRLHRWFTEDGGFIIRLTRASGMVDSTEVTPDGQVTRYEDVLAGRTLARRFKVPVGVKMTRITANGRVRTVYPYRFYWTGGPAGASEDG